MQIQQIRACIALVLLSLLLNDESILPSVAGKFRGAKPKPIPVVSADGQVVEGKHSLTCAPHLCPSPVPNRGAVCNNHPFIPHAMTCICVTMQVKQASPNYSRWSAGRTSLWQGAGSGAARRAPYPGGCARDCA